MRKIRIINKEKRIVMLPTENILNELRKKVQELDWKIVELVLQDKLK